MGQYKTEDLKKKVKEASKKYSLETLTRGIKKKGANLKYEKLETQTYLLSDKLNTDQAKLMFSLRAGMIHCKTLYKNMYNNRQDGLLCSMCSLEPETPEHAVVQCAKLEVRMTYKYEDIFSSDEVLSIAALKNFETVWKLRQATLKKSQVDKSTIDC